MESMVLYSHAVFDLPSPFSLKKQLKLRKHLFPLREGSLVCGSGKEDKFHSTVPINSCDRRESYPSEKVADSRKREEIMGLLRRIRSSIAKLETANLQSNKALLSHKSSNQLKDAIAKKEGKKPTRGKQPEKKEQKLHNNGQTSSGIRACRPPSSFSKRSPIPHLTAPKRNNPFDQEDLKSQNDRQGSSFDYRASRLLSSFSKRLPIPSPTEIRQNPSEVKSETSTISIIFKDMKMPQLREMAKKRGIRGYSKLKKSELLNLLSS